MNWWRRLPTRLVVSYAAVVVTGMVALLLTTRVLVPRLFDRRVGNGRGPAASARGAEMHDAVVAALDRSLLVAMIVSLIAAGAIALVVARQILRPIERVRAATRQIAAGHYDALVEPPTEIELAALADDVNALARSLSGTERRRAELVGDIAHELRTPLTTIRGYAEGIADGVIVADPDVLGAMLSEVDRLQRLAGDLSTLSRVEEDAPARVAVPVDLGEVAASVVANLRPQADSKRIRVEVEGTAMIVGDRDRLVQLVTNLVANAITYTPDDGTVRVHATRRGAEAILTVSDSGIGLEGDDVERVFERFYRVAGVDRPPGGSGIGLAIARTIARAHHGELTASSSGANLGTTFTLRLPSDPARDPPPT